MRKPRPLDFMVSSSLDPFREAMQVYVARTSRLLVRSEVASAFGGDSPDG